MNDIERIYSLLLHSNGLKIRAISQELELDKYYVAEIMFSSQNIPYWYQDDDSLWYAKEGALQIEEPEEEIDELITPVEIPQRFNVNRFLEEDLSDSLRSYLSQISKYRIYSNDEMIELFKRYRNGDQKAFDLIIKSQQRLVANISFLYCRKGAPLEDIIQEGNVGLVKAAERFDYTQYRSFSNYAKSGILQSISASMTTMPYTVRLPLNQLLLYRKVSKFKEKFEQIHGFNPSINDIEIGEDIDTERIKYLDELPNNLSSLTSLSNDLDIKESDTNSIDEFVNRNEAQMTVMNLLRRLSKRERQIIQRFYGINTKEETLSAIGEYLGLTRERARQIKEKTVKHLRDIFQNRKDKDEKEFIMQDEDNIPNSASKLPKSLIKKRKHIEMYADSENIPNIQNKQKHLTDKKEQEEILHDVNEIDNLKVGDEIYYNKKYCTIRKIIHNGRYSKLFIEYADGVMDVVSYKFKFDRISKITKSNQHNHLHEVEYSSNKEKKEAMIGDIIKYDTKLCTVLEKKTINNTLRIIVKNEDGTIDNLHNDWNRYIIVNHRKEDNIRKDHHLKTERYKYSNFQLSTPLSFLVSLEIITEKQLYHCHKKGLMTIGDVKQIIEKNNLTPNSTRFTKYTLDMWFSIISLLKKF